MTMYLDIDENELRQQDAYWTAREIAQQPVMWRQTLQQLEAQTEEWSAWLTALLQDGERQLVLTGAGTSAFIGEILLPLLSRRFPGRVRAIATTDIVSGPQHWFDARQKLLLVSFARSGNSPESVAALQLADELGQDCHHLIFTCNREGALYRSGRDRDDCHVVLLPEATHDRSFAMTSSFSSMLLAAAAMFGLLPGDLEKCLRAATRLLDAQLPLLRRWSELAVTRVVFLGSGALAGLAREAALKLLELTDGRILALHETPLGFRHGPKTVVNDRTLILMLLSNDPYTAQYERDLLQELQRDGRAAQVLTLSAPALTGADGLSLPELSEASDIELAFPYAVAMQAYAFYCALAIGNRPDHPSASGTVNRVVQGVTIYPFLRRV